MPIYDPATGKSVMSGLLPTSMPAAGESPMSAVLSGAQPVAGAAPAPSVTYPSIGTGTVYSDPAMLAFLRSSGMANEVAAADVARQTAATKMGLGINEDQLAENGMRSRRNIAGSHEARGVFRSGAHLRARGEQESDQARQLNSLRLNAANSLSGLQTDLLSRIAGNQQRAAEMGLNTAQDQSQQRRLAEGGLL